MRRCGSYSSVCSLSIGHRHSCNQVRNRCLCKKSKNEQKLLTGENMHAKRTATPLAIAGKTKPSTMRAVPNLPAFPITLFALLAAVCLASATDIERTLFFEPTEYQEKGISKESAWSPKYVGQSEFYVGWDSKTTYRAAVRFDLEEVMRQVGGAGRVTGMDLFLRGWQVEYTDSSSRQLGCACSIPPGWITKTFPSGTATTHLAGESRRDS
jgi:hypothetical protein